MGQPATADSEGHAVSPPVVAWFARASRCLNRANVRCPEHGIAHTGKLARSIPLDLALLDATGNDTYWEQAVRRAHYVALRLGPDPQHGAYVFYPGRLDPRNCSNSVIDSGECTDALARLLMHPRAASLAPEHTALFAHAVETNAETYLHDAVVDKEIVNQRLWGAMGLAAAYQWQPRETWRDAIAASVARSLVEQRPDGSWGYETEPERHGVFAGAADLTVYYHGRCLAFLLRIVECVPDIDPNGAIAQAIVRGLDFLAAIIMPDGLKPLALEGKRWFFDGYYEAGSAAYDVYALRKGAARFNRPDWHALAIRAWEQLARHQEADGGIRGCLDSGAVEFVCRDFHTADLAWPAQVMEGVWGREQGSGVWGLGSGTGRPVDSDPVLPVHHFPAAGIVRLERSGTVALLRTATTRRNTLYGGPASGGALASIGHDITAGRTFDFRQVPQVGGFTLWPRQPDRVAGMRRFWRANPPGREGRQWLFFARLLLTQRRPLAAVGRLWRGYGWPLAMLASDVAASYWATTSTLTLGGNDVQVTCQPASWDGHLPAWTARLTATRHVALDGNGRLHIEDRLDGPGSGMARVVYLLPAPASGLTVDSSGFAGDSTAMSNSLTGGGIDSAGHQASTQGRKPDARLLKLRPDQTSGRDGRDISLRVAYTL